MPWRVFAVFDGSRRSVRARNGLDEGVVLSEDVKYVLAVIVAFGALAGAGCIDAPPARPMSSPDMDATVEPDAQADALDMKATSEPDDGVPDMRQELLDMNMGLDMRLPVDMKICEPRAEDEVCALECGVASDGCREGAYRCPDASERYALALDDAAISCAVIDELCVAGRDSTYAHTCGDFDVCVAGFCVGDGRILPRGNGAPFSDDLVTLSPSKIGAVDFGAALIARDDLLLIGAPKYKDPQWNYACGKVAIIERAESSGAWDPAITGSTTELVRCDNTNPRNYDYGRALAFDGQRVAVSYYNHASAPLVDVWERSSGDTLDFELVATIARPADVAPVDSDRCFGKVLEWSDGLLAVGAGCSGGHASVSVFGPDPDAGEWTRVLSFEPDTNVIRSEHGKQIEIVGALGDAESMVFVSAAKGDPMTSSGGVFNVYTLTPGAAEGALLYSKQMQLGAPEGVEAKSDSFARALASSEQYLAVGEPEYTTAEDGTIGRVLLYKLDRRARTVTQIAQVTRPDGMSSERVGFGAKIVMNEHSLLIATDAGATTARDDDGVYLYNIEGLAADEAPTFVTRFRQGENMLGAPDIINPGDAIAISGTTLFLSDVQADIWSADTRRGVVTYHSIYPGAEPGQIAISDKVP